MRTKEEMEQVLLDLSGRLELSEEDVQLMYWIQEKLNEHSPN